MFKPFRLLGGLVMLAVAAAAAGPAVAQNVTKQLSSESVLETIKKRGKLRAGVSAFVPWVMRAKDGSMIGFEIDIAKAIAKDMEVDVEFIPTAFSGIIPALLAGEFDIIITGISLVPKRNLTVNFSNPYNWSGIGMAANKKLTAGWTKDDWNKESVIFTVRRGSNDSIQSVRKVSAKAQIKQFDDDAQAVQDVLNGTAHAFVTAEPKPTNYALDYPDQIWRPFGSELLLRWPSSFAVRKGDPDILNFLNNWITLAVERGFIQERHEYWFRGREWKDLVAAQ